MSDYYCSEHKDNSGPPFFRPSEAAGSRLEWVKYADSLEARIHEACEVYAGMEGVDPKNPAEQYLLLTLGHMYQELLSSTGEEG